MTTEAGWIPKVGDQAHVRIWTDVYPLTVTEVNRAGTRIVCREAKAELDPEGSEWVQGGFAPVLGRQKWNISDDPNGREWRASYRPKIGKWKVQGSRLREPGMFVGPGWRRHDDPNF